MDIMKMKLYSELFENDIAKTKKKYRDLAKQFHPDTSNHKDSALIFEKIHIFYEEAEKAIMSDNWVEKNTLILKSHDKRYKIKYLKQDSFELGLKYYSTNNVVYVLNKEHKKYYDNAIKILRNLKYSSKDMEKEFKRYVPEIKANFQCIDGRYVLVFAKSKGDYSLKDVKTNYDLSARHLTWIVSRLSNIACFLKYNGIVHNGISIENCLICPEFHTVLLYGGWWYATKEGDTMIGTQKSIYDIMPVKDKTEKIANTKTDLESIKLLGRQYYCKDTPKEILKWFDKASGDDSYEEYNDWYKTVDMAYGVRKFIPLTIDENKFYN